MIRKINKLQAEVNTIFILDDIKKLKELPLKAEERSYIQDKNKKTKVYFFEFDRLTHYEFVQIMPEAEADYAKSEKIRLAGDSFCQRFKCLKLANLQLVDYAGNFAPAFLEGFCLSAYTFEKYKTKANDKQIFSIVNVLSENLKAKDISALNAVIEYVYFCRDLVNEPHNNQNAVQFTAILQKTAKKLGVKATVFDKKKIELEKMGGLLGVNKGSINPPSFAVLEWTPKTKTSKKPIVLVGKGLVFDTGGLNLKTGSYMDDMKQDMAGGALMASTLFALAQLKLNRPLVALIPATDNRPNGNALVPGDVITMRSGKTVEVTNTDAEGRLILADALDYAKKYKPELVIDAATLTGAASRAIGKYGIVAMQQKADKPMDLLKKSGWKTYERIAEMPFWDEYKDDLKSEVADMQNSGSGIAGAITAGKFLAEFTDYPYIHMDIAGVAFVNSRYNYHGNQATGFGLRLLVDFLLNY